MTTSTIRELLLSQAEAYYSEAVLMSWVLDNARRNPKTASDIPALEEKDKKAWKKFHQTKLVYDTAVTALDTSESKNASDVVLRIAESLFNSGKIDLDTKKEILELYTKSSSSEKIHQSA